MQKGHLVLPAIIACAAVFPAAARAEGPTFDCARAQGRASRAHSRPTRPRSGWSAAIAP